MGHIKHPVMYAEISHSARRPRRMVYFLIRGDFPVQIIWSLKAQWPSLQFCTYSLNDNDDDNSSSSSSSSNKNKNNNNNK
jgi:hypothetical protein